MILKSSKYASCSLCALRAPVAWIRFESWFLFCSFFKWMYACTIPAKITSPLQEFTSSFVPFLFTQKNHLILIALIKVVS